MLAAFPKRSAIAVLMSALLVMTVVCLSTCAFAAESSHACCHKHRSGSVMRQCAYTQLERTKMASAAPVAVTHLAPLSWTPRDYSQSPAVFRQPADSSNLFLKLRVLLI